MYDGFKCSFCSKVGSHTCRRELITAIAEDDEVAELLYKAYKHYFYGEEVVEAQKRASREPPYLERR
jgi:hypothetical protein